MTRIWDSRHAGRTYVISGGAQGIGLAYARRLGQEGAEVVVTDINKDALNQACAALSKEGIKVRQFELDVSDAEANNRFAEFLQNEFTCVHGLVNNAAVFATLELKPFWDIDPAEWDKVMAVNVRGPWLMVRSLLPFLEAANGSSVVNIGSDAVWAGKELYLHYVASKGAVFGMTNAMARELGPKSIRVNTLSPGFTTTEVPRATFTEKQRSAILAGQALSRVAGTDDMVGVASFLLSSESGWITGQTLHVNGGMSCH